MVLVLVQCPGGTVNVRRRQTGGRKMSFCGGLLLNTGPPHWLWPGSAPSRPLAVVKRLMGDEPSVMRVDLSPRAWSIFTWRTRDTGQFKSLSQPIREGDSSHPGNSLFICRRQRRDADWLK